ncbi:PEP/pyruvate-binding domain-containing protein [Tenacibaculum sp. IB213877]|uniref:PEP/pyruvate-binding domain-containing protein n=1 Tax=Tenacibaculum sp. IB213877 TaxID=3097351 RepID=UPI002A59FBCC|nr:PEP/pyruvate-binding domain-containing protein [Tenacibaculum sp. IB213877]MDY0780607.1 PEP/pyruvate-binding domain-containing protein [Tenacibaculum sp. IB213877]
MIKKLTMCLFFFVLASSLAQEKSSKEIEKLIRIYKKDVRGPYYRIKWFCKDGTIRDPKDPCPDSIGGGNQHATFKESALELRKTNHLFFGEILTGLNKKEFLDSKNDYSRLKQYQIGKYLANTDDGWILRRGQYYRGAIQSEDEKVWGKEFFEWLLKDTDFIDKNYYVLRQALKDIPHNEDTNLTQKIRSESKLLAEEVPSFMDIRIKIHGQPQASDIQLVKKFIEENKSKLTSEQKKGFYKLLSAMKSYYKPIDFTTLASHIKDLPKNNTTEVLLNFLENNNKNTSPKILVSEISDALYAIRLGINDYPKTSDRLQLLDLSNNLESTLLKEAQKWQTENLEENLYKISSLSCAAAGTGLIESWEYGRVQNQLDKIKNKETLTIEQLNEVLLVSRSMVEWSAAMVKAKYQDIVDIYTEFEPLAYGFIDDRVRSSVALSLGDEVSKLGGFVANISHIENKVMKIDNQSAIHGLNPGYAYGKLIVVDENPEYVKVNANHIYIFQKPPSDLKPVAGIMTVSEGNLVSHVQLLARNLGIPNAALSYQNLKDLKKYHGQEVFYAVSNKGNVLMKTALEMSDEEKQLFAKKEQNTSIITVPTDKIELDKKQVVDMKTIDASYSGKLCGPKAANLAELKKMFPEKVVEGLIIPFGIFREHMNQIMPEEDKSYWAYLNDTFAQANEMKAKGISSKKIANFQLRALKKLHKAIINIPLQDDFVNDLKSQFIQVFGNKIGSIPVFLRSDTNMEDLKEFTGAGLNLTLFNILSEEAIINGIKQVWASPYTERSFKWRQSYLANPENVFPSILIIPSVDVDYSGVMITTGVNSGNSDDLTVAFSRGAGGAVDGQRAETRLITQNDDYLLTPARENDYIRLPQTGSTQPHIATFESPILNQKNIKHIRELAKTIRNKMPDNQAYDVEFGFKNDKLWLFQIRPFVENKTAKSSSYLNSITPKVDADTTIALTTKI